MNMEKENKYLSLLKLFHDDFNIDKDVSKIKIDLYLVLMSLNKLDNFSEVNDNEYKIISDFLRKLNNIKVKVQLRRKKNEIDRLALELLKEYRDNVVFLSNYINKYEVLEDVVTKLDVNDLTSVIDKATKIKMDNFDEFSNRDSVRKNIINSCNYWLEDNILVFSEDNGTCTRIDYDLFREHFCYLLDSNNYKDIYNKKNIQNMHEIIRDRIINLLIKDNFSFNEIDEDIIISILFNRLCCLDKNNYLDLDMTKFIVDNIKITELYSFANNDSSDSVKEKCSKWRNIFIPNDYLVDKIWNMIENGMFYFQDNCFVMEQIIDNVPEFRVKINKDDLYNYLIIVENKRKEKDNKDSVLR